MRQYLLSLSLTLTLTNCFVLNPDFVYSPKSIDEYYFPLLSEEFTKRENDCLEKNISPCNFPEPDDTLNDFVNRWYSKHLKSMKEPILYKLRDENRKIIRFTHLGTWSNPFSYRIENDKGKIILTYNKTNGLGGFEAGRRIKHKEKIMKKNTWDKIIKKIDQIDFWKMKTHDTNMVLHGGEWIVEVLIDDRYHFVTRNSPDIYGEQKYVDLCKLIMKANKQKS